MVEEQEGAKSPFTNAAVITLYTIHCHKCNILEERLNKANVKYVVNEDIEEMRARGYTTAPMLDIDGTSYTFEQSLKLLATRGK